MPPVSGHLQLGAALRERRERAGLTQAELAARANVSRDFVTEIERRRRPRAELMGVLSVIRALDADIIFVDRDTRSAEQMLEDLLADM
ncbi:helix-turn-helix transcriptional regulator [Cellulosimicrobium sp. TH-20]|uniref:helix-turn-helix domain-containing protein n=1 Tax=Cellulosimicrobium sp. TH-20 TaxID=1980001 RepID=UPI0015829A3F